jgi:non-specific serine/threonine protein kinase
MCSTTRKRNNLPRPLTSFVGRERILAEMVRQLSPDPTACPLLTLTGPGGSGKTRLALQAATTLLPRYEHGAWFVSLAPISDPGLVAPTIAQVIGARDANGVAPAETVQRYLGNRRALIVLDNFEQVLGAAGELTQLLSACPRVQLLVTSREALRVSGERELAIPPLQLPPDDPQRGAAVDAIAEAESVRLFVDRATAVKPDFVLSEQNASIVADLCRRLDGLPLAIELAAGRVRVLDVKALRSRLEHRLQFLTAGPRDLPTRQQTLRNTIAWSYDLLQPHEQALFRTVAVFVGGCTLDAVEQVSAERRDVLEGVESLVGKSLLRSVAEAPGEVRVTMLETTREFGLEQLAWMGELEVLRRRHAEYFLSLAERAEPELWGPDAGAWHIRLDVEHDNLRAALDWALTTAADGAVSVGLRLAAALARFWWTRSYHREGLQWLTRALAAAPARSAARMKALHGAAFLTHMLHNSTAARVLLEESLSIARELTDAWTEAWVLHVLGRISYFDNNPTSARAFAEQSFAIAERLRDPWLIGWSLHLQALAAHVAGDYPAADELYERSMAIRRALGFREQIGVLSQLMGISRHRQGDFAGARRLYQDYLDIARELGSTFHANNVLAILGSLAAAQGQPERAARLLGAAQASCDASQTRPIPLAEALTAEGIELARSALSNTAFTSAWAAGRALSSEEAIAEALAVEVADPGRTAAGAPKPGRSHAGPLSEREEQVARLVAQGLTNRQIAAALVVSTRTVETHIEHILARLGFVSRTQIGIWAAGRDSSFADR